MVAYLILCNFVLFLDFLNNRQFLTKNQDGKFGKEEGTKYSALEKIWKKRRKEQPARSDCVGNKRCDVRK
jgi:hypothetical protein